MFEELRRCMRMFHKLGRAHRGRGSASPIASLRVVSKDVLSGGFCSVMLVFFATGIWFSRTERD